MRGVVFAFAALAFASPAMAKPWTVDHANSKLGFTASMQGASIDGTFNQWNAEIEFDPANLGAAHAKVTVDLNSAGTGNESRDKALPTQTWFDTSGSSGFAAGDGGPSQAVFETTTFRQTGEGAYEADGMLSMRGASNQVTLPFTLRIDGSTATMDGKATIDRTQWGIGQGDYANGDTVATAVDVVVHLTATAP